MAGELEALDAGEGWERRRHRPWCDRLKMPADGVFAIAITCLIVEIATPTGWNGDLGALWALRRLGARPYVG